MKTRLQLEDEIKHIPDGTMLDRIMAEILLDIRDLLMPAAAQKQPGQAQKPITKKEAEAQQEEAEKLI